MRKAVIVLLMLAIVFPAFAIDGSDVAYTGGTISQLTPGSTGKFDLSRGTELLFVSTAGSFGIPYSRIESYEHSQEVAVHLGVAPAIAVGLVKHRRRNHFLRITFKDNENLSQVAVFEIPKTMPRILMPVLAARAPQVRCASPDECGPLYRPMPRPIQPPANPGAGNPAAAPAAAPASALK